MSRRSILQFQNVFVMAFHKKSTVWGRLSSLPPAPPPPKKKRKFYFCRRPIVSETSLKKYCVIRGLALRCPDSGCTVRSGSDRTDSWEKLNQGVSKPGCFPLFSKVQIVSRTLSGLFLVGALYRPRKRKRTNRENPRTIPEQIGKIPEKSGKSQKGQKRTKRKDESRSGTPPI